MKNSKYLIYLLLLALFVRIFLLFPQYSGDVKNHFVWGNGLLVYPIGIYSRHFSGFNDINYPPLAIYLFAASNLLLNGLNSLLSFLNNSISFFPSFLIPLFRAENMSMGFLKLPGILSDIGIGFLIYKIAVFLKSPKPLLLSIFYLLNPAIIYVSSVWGQIEPVTNFFLILSLYLAIVPKNKFKYFSIPIFCLAALVKQTAFWFIPFYLVLWLKDINWQGIVKGLLSAIAIFFVSYLPVGLGPVESVKSYISTLSGSSNGVTDNAWNLWYFLLPTHPADSFMIGFVSVRLLSITLLLSLLFVLIYKLIRKYSLQKLLMFLFLWSLAVFFLQTRVHERHLAPALVFGLLAFANNPAWYIGYIFLSIFHFLNLFLTLKIPFI